jgi:5-methyltetrahydropteroyltriglutamate--homocysteine methyltransferase
MNDSLFPTTVIGSLPRPVWLRELILDRKAGRVSEQEADRVLDRAIESAILLQKRAGLGEITDANGAARATSRCLPNVCEASNTT